MFIDNIHSSSEDFTHSFWRIIIFSFSRRKYFYLSRSDYHKMIKRQVFNQYIYCMFRYQFSWFIDACNFPNNYSVEEKAKLQSFSHIIQSGYFLFISSFLYLLALIENLARLNFLNSMEWIQLQKHVYNNNGINVLP